MHGVCNVIVQGEMVARAPLEHPLVAALGLDPTMRKALHLSAAMPTTSMDGSAANMARDKGMHKTVSDNSLASKLETWVLSSVLLSSHVIVWGPVLSPSVSKSDSLHHRWHT
jgi:hypothetical protein